MNMKILLAVEFEAPEGATHYTGNFPDYWTWWKFLVNSTGAVRVWCYWDERRNEWLVQGEHEPNGLRELKPLNGSGGGYSDGPMSDGGLDPRNDALERVAAAVAVLDQAYAEADAQDAANRAENPPPEEWEDDDPRAMGWVDDRGRP
jgi:hypothetical protein